jgi:hypothetical protein
MAEDPLNARRNHRNVIEILASHSEDKNGIFNNDDAEEHRWL